MDESRHLILIKNEDKTKEVKNIEVFGNYSIVTFRQGKSYRYNKENVIWKSNPKILDIKNKEIKVSGENIYNVYQIFIFDKFVKILFYDRTSRITYRGKIKLVAKSESVKSTDVFQYIKDLSKVLKIEIDEDESFLSKQYNKIISVHSNSVLMKYIKQRKINRITNLDNVIMPFGFNISQVTGTRNALNYDLSIIEGPPGTGKTQTILNIIANAIIKDKNIAIVSNNNSATSNVQEKLKEYDLAFISAFLGSRENKEKFLNNQEDTIPDITNWKQKGKNSNNLYYKLKVELKEILELSNKANKQAINKTELNDLTKEYEYYLKSRRFIRKIENKRLNKMRSDDITHLINDLRVINRESFIAKIKFFIKYRTPLSKVTFESLEQTLDSMNVMFYEKRIKELNDEILYVKKELNNVNFEKRLKRYQEDSMKYFKMKLYTMYKGKNRPVYSSEDLFYRFDNFVKDFPVILSTTHSIRSMSKNEFLYDYVIIDEASQSDIVSGSLALSVAKKATIVGDRMQLPHVVSREVAEISSDIFNKYEIDEVYDYSLSLLESISSIGKMQIPYTLLREHYRCEPDIINFCNKKFYKSELIVHTKSVEKTPLKVLLTVDGNHARGNYNQRQIDVIKDEVIPKVNINKSLGIITPFRDQANRMRLEFNDENLDSDTVHKYQGRERDVIIISTVANNIEPGSFVDNKNLINVAVSRAKKQLVLVTSKNIIGAKGTNLYDLTRYVEYNNMEVNTSKVVSVFDSLYKCNSREAEKRFKNVSKISEYMSENLIYNLLLEILSIDKYSSISIMYEYPLRELITLEAKLTTEEYNFGTNPNSHVDFLLYSDVTKEPLLVIEVDGYAYHNKNEIQKKRDTKKNSILQKNNIPILRLNTTGSGERQRILDELNKIYN